MTTFNARPQVMFTSPKNYAVDVSTRLETITLGLNTDLDANHVQGNVRVEDSAGRFVKTQVSYLNRTITIKILEELASSTTYNVIVLGDSSLDDTVTVGVRNVFGDALAGQFRCTFTTVKVTTLPAPEPLFPQDQVVIKTKPALSWRAVGGATAYQLELYRSNTMDVLIWPIPPEPTYENTTGPITPNIPMPDGQYYWRVRAVGGEWTKLLQFNLDTTVEGTVAEEDTLPPEERVQYDPFLDFASSDVLEIFPKDQDTNIATNLETIYFTVLGTIDIADVSIEVIGESVTGEGTDHGTLTGTLEVLPQPNGTTIIAFTPDALPAPTTP